MEYASLCWINASPSTLALLDNIQKKALKIIRVIETAARTQFSIPSLTHRRQVAAASVLYKMQTQHCPQDLVDMLPPPMERRRVTRFSTSMPDHALTIPHARTHSLDRSFIHSAVRVWNSLPEKVVGNISDTGLQAFKGRVHALLLSKIWLFNAKSFKWINVIPILCFDILFYFELQRTTWLAFRSFTKALVGYCSQLHYYIPPKKNPSHSSMCSIIIHNVYTTVL